MARNGVAIDLEHDPDAQRVVGVALAAWHTGEYAGFPAPRARWLSDLERELVALYPESTAADRAVTARGLAPFVLVQAP